MLFQKIKVLHILKIFYKLKIYKKDIIYELYLKKYYHATHENTIHYSFTCLHSLHYF